MFVHADWNCQSSASLRLRQAATAARVQLVCADTGRPPAPNAKSNRIVRQQKSQSGSQFSILDNSISAIMIFSISTDRDRSYNMRFSRLLQHNNKANPYQPVFFYDRSYNIINVELQALFLKPCHERPARACSTRIPLSQAPQGDFQPTNKNMHKRQKDLTNTSEKATITEMSVLRVARSDGQ
jgi:hypothetical protein